MLTKNPIRNMSLLGGGVLALFLLLPADKADSAGVTAPERSLLPLAASPELVEYLKASLSTSPVSSAIATSKGAVPIATGVESVAQVDAQAINAASTLSEGAPVVAKTAATVSEENLMSVDAPVNVRSRPAKTSSRLFVLRASDKVQVLAYEANWAQIRTEDGNEGWVYSSLLADPRSVKRPAVSDAPMAKQAATIDPEPKVVAGKAKVFRLAGATVLRSRPSNKAERIGTIKSGAKVTVAEWDGAWVRIVLPSGVSGWIRSVGPS